MYIGTPYHEGNKEIKTYECSLFCFNLYVVTFCSDNLWLHFSGSCLVVADAYGTLSFFEFAKRKWGQKDTSVQNLIT